MRVQYECIPSAGCFFHSLEESGHLEGMVLSVFLQSVEESARGEVDLRAFSSSDWGNLSAGSRVSGVIVPVSGGFCPLRGWFAGGFFQ